MRDDIRTNIFDENTGTTMEGYKENKKTLGKLSFLHIVVVAVVLRICSLLWFVEVICLIEHCEHIHQTARNSQEQHTEVEESSIPN